MARPRSFCEQQVINAAMNAFWQHGYESTSMCDLESATGLKRISIYNAFGDKEGMFLAALDMYSEQGKTMLEETVPQGGLSGITLLFNRLIEDDNSESPHQCGCLMVNALLDVHKATPAVKERLMKFRSLVTQAFRTALQNARKEQHLLVDDVIIEKRVAWLCGSLWGAIASIRIEQKTEAAREFVAVVTEHVESWKVSQ